MRTYWPFKSGQSGLWAGLWVLLLLFFTGCHKPFSEGFYFGTMIRNESASERKQKEVSIQSIKLSQRKFELKVLDLQDQLLLSGFVKFKGAGHVVLEFSEFSSDPIHLMRTPVQTRSALKWTCFAGNTLEKEWARVCQSPDRIRMQLGASESSVPRIDLSATYVSEPSRIPFENSVKLGVSESITMALKQNFHSMAQFQRTLQAIHQAKAAQMALFPSMNGQALLTLATLNPYPIATFIGHFFPFLIPNRWFRVEERRDQSKVAQLALQLVQLNLANEIEKLSYLLNRDLNLLKWTQDELAKARLFLLQLKTRHGKEKLAYRYTYVITGLRLETARLQLIIENDRRALSAALGFLNPKGIQEVSLEPDPLPITDAHPLNEEKVAQQAVHRSLEIRQLDYLIGSAKAQKKCLYFGWMDPRSPNTESFTLSLIDQIRSAGSWIEELKITRKEQLAKLIQRAYDIVDQYNTSIKTYSPTLSVFEYQTRRLEQFQAKVMTELPKLDTEVVYLELKDSLKSKMDYGSRLESILANYRISRSNLRRMLLSDLYSQIYPLMTEEKILNDHFSVEEFEDPSKDSDLVTLEDDSPS